MASHQSTVSRREDNFFDRFNEIEYANELFLRYIGRYKFPKSEKLQILKALDFAALAHNGQHRDEGPLYVIHPIRVANVLMHELLTMKVDLICAALLHDVIEGCDITVGEVRNNFNDSVAQMVKTMTKDSRLTSAKKVYFETIRNADEQTRLLKLCDRLDNLRSLRFNTNSSKIRRYISESEKRYLGLAADLNRYLFREMKHEMSVLKNRLRKQ